MGTDEKRKHGDFNGTTRITTGLSTASKKSGMGIHHEAADRRSEAGSELSERDRRDQMMNETLIRRGVELKGGEMDRRNRPEWRFRSDEIIRVVNHVQDVNLRRVKFPATRCDALSHINNGCPWVESYIYSDIPCHDQELKVRARREVRDLVKPGWNWISGLHAETEEMAS